MTLKLNHSTKFDTLNTYSLCIPYKENLYNNQEVLDLAIISFIPMTLMFDSEGVWTKRGVGHGLSYGVIHGLPCGLPYGLPVVRFLKT